MFLYGFRYMIFPKKRSADCGDKGKETGIVAAEKEDKMFVLDLQSGAA
jgi:hypothetical protein